MSSPTLPKETDTPQLRLTERWGWAVNSENDYILERCSNGDWVRYDDCQALRERAEAAEELLAHMMQVQRCTVDAANEARRAEAAAWNDAVEAAAKTALDRQGKRTMGDGHGNSCYDVGISDATTAIRALRRAAPTEGEA